MIIFYDGWLLEVNYKRIGWLLFKINFDVYLKSSFVESVLINKSCSKCFYSFSIWLWTSISWLKYIKYCSFDSIPRDSLAQLINQWSCIYNMSSSRPCVNWKGQLCEGRHREESWMGCSRPHLSYKNVPKFGTGIQGKKRAWVKKHLLKTVALVVKLWRKSIEKLKRKCRKSLCNERS